MKIDLCCHTWPPSLCGSDPLPSVIGSLTLFFVCLHHGVSDCKVAMFSQPMAELRPCRSTMVDTMDNWASDNMNLKNG